MCRESLQEDGGREGRKWIQLMEKKADRTDRQMDGWMMERERGLVCV